MVDNSDKSLSDEAKQAFIFGYLRGNMKGIYGSFAETHTKKQSDKKWKDLVRRTTDLHSLLCRQTGIDEGVTEELSKFITDMEDELEEITEVYA